MPYLPPILLLGSFLVILAFLFSLFWFVSVAVPLFFGFAPWVSSNQKRTTTMMLLANLQPTDHVVDMGSGDGKLLFAAIKAGAGSADGYEINPILASICRLKIRYKKLTGRVTIFTRSCFQADLSKTDVIFIYQLPNTMTKLSDKLMRELPVGARIVSNTFPLLGFKPSLIKDGVYLYQT